MREREALLGCGGGEEGAPPSSLSFLLLSSVLVNVINRLSVPLWQVKSRQLGRLWPVLRTVCPKEASHIHSRSGVRYWDKLSAIQNVRFTGDVWNLVVRV